MLRGNLHITKKNSLYQRASNPDFITFLYSAFIETIEFSVPELTLLMVQTIFKKIKDITLQSLSFFNFYESSMAFDEPLFCTTAHSDFHYKLCSHGGVKIENICRILSRASRWLLYLKVSFQTLNTQHKFIQPHHGLLIHFFLFVYQL